MYSPKGGGIWSYSTCPRGRGNWLHTGQIPALSPWGGTWGNTLIGALRLELVCRDFLTYIYSPVPLMNSSCRAKKKSSCSSAQHTYKHVTFKSMYCACVRACVYWACGCSLFRNHRWQGMAFFKATICSRVRALRRYAYHILWYNTY